MNTFLLIGTVANNYEVIYRRDKDDLQLVKFYLKVPRVTKKLNPKVTYDMVQIKVWTDVVSDITETLALDQILSVEGMVQSFRYCDKKTQQIQYYNDFVASKINNLTLW